MNRNTLPAPLALLRQRLAEARMRLPVLVTGAADDVLQQVLAWSKPEQEQWLWLSSRAPSGAWYMLADKANHELGREADVVVVDLFDGFAVDAVAALAGVVRAGGLLVLLAPPLAQWPVFDDPQYRRLAVEPYGIAGVRRHFLARLARQLADDARLVQVSGDAISIPDLPLPPAPADEADEWGCRTAAQRKVVQAILTQSSFNNAPPLVIQADRGRGKSAALGIAASRLAGQGQRIIVTAPRPEAAATLMLFAGSGNVEFFAPDRLAQTHPAADLLLVDEAAALAPGLLKTLLAHYPKVVLATTVQGYEGTGQGFNTRFAHYLDQQFPRWQKWQMEQPIRWASGDPLEAFVHDALLLNACDEPPVPAAIDRADLHWEDLTPQLGQLAEPRLRAVHGLLVAAHYRTRPSDLRTLLDGPNVRTFAVSHGDHVIAVAMVAEEGCLPAPLAADILAGKRRPRGHVLAQSLAVHLNVAQALAQPQWRIVRIAVHSHWQRRGVGRWLLQQLEQQAQQEQVAFLGSVFAATDSVLAFWQHNGFRAVRIGLSRESTSGAFPVMVLKGLSETGSATTQQARQRFEQTFLHGLADTPAPWPANLVLHAWQQAYFPQHETLYPADVDDIQHYIAGHKTCENAAVALARQARIWLGMGLVQQCLTAPQQALLIGRLLQKQPWATLAMQGGYTGHKQARAALREAIRLLHQQQPALSCLSS